MIVIEDKTPAATYQQYIALSRKVADLGGALQLMGWDQEILMPAGAVQRRSSQIATLAEVRHRIVMHELMPAIQDLLAKDQLTATEKLNVLQSFKELSRFTRLPTEFVAQLAKANSEGQFAWEESRRKNDFAIFLPALTHIITLKKQEAEYYGYSESPYNALLDSYEPGLTVAQLDPLFSAIKPKLIHILNSIKAAPQPRTDFLSRFVPDAAQWDFSIVLLQKLGFNFNNGRQDRSTHPFTTGTAMEDVRLTTRIDEHDISGVMYSTIHECGHGLYEQGLNPEYYGLPQAEACSLSIHESQSRIWENNVCRSEAFWTFCYPQFAELFEDKLAGITARDVYKAMNVVQPGLVRVMADEVTYHFHVILRYEIEKELIEGRMQVADLPAFWNDSIEQYLGLRPKNDIEGVLQDIHWSVGNVGYFPTYSLGSFYAAQFMHKAQQSIPNLDAAFAVGDFSQFHTWLAQNIYQHGRLFDSETLCRRVCGEPLRIEYFLEYICKKLSDVYGVTISADSGN